MKISEIIGKLVYDEIRLIRFSRCLTLRRKDELLREITEKLIACYPIDPYMHLSAEPSKDAIEELSQGVAQGQEAGNSF